MNRLNSIIPLAALSMITLAPILLLAAAPPTPAAVKSDEKTAPSKTLPSYRLIDEAARAIEQGDFDRAIELYGRARQRLPELAQIPYNQAVAHYRKGDFQRAAELFEQAAQLAEQDDLRNRATYNLGNTVYKQGKQAIESQDDPNLALQQIDQASDRMTQALKHFKQAVNTDPDDADARHNAELTHKMLKQLEDLKEQLEQQQQQQQQDNQEQQDQQQDQQQPPSDQQENATDQQRADSTPQQGEDENQQPQSQEQPQEQDQSQQGEQDDQEQQEGEQDQPPTSGEQNDEESEDETESTGRPQDETREPMSKEQADRLLQSVRDKERQRREQLARRQAKNQPPVEKDW